MREKLERQSRRDERARRIAEAEAAGIDPEDLDLGEEVDDEPEEEEEELSMGRDGAWPLLRGHDVLLGLPAGSIAAAIKAASAVSQGQVDVSCVRGDGSLVVLYDWPSHPRADA